MRIVVDFEKCAGLGLCESIAEDVFEVRDDGNMVLLQEEIGEDQRDMIQDAVDSCPTEALRLEE